MIVLSVIKINNQKLIINLKIPLVTKQEEQKKQTVLLSLPPLFSPSLLPPSLPPSKGRQNRGKRGGKERKDREKEDERGKKRFLARIFGGLVWCCFLFVFL